MVISSPSRNSSIKTVDPALPNLFFSRDALRDISASLILVAKVTPFPAAKPSALIPIGAPFYSTYLKAGSNSVKDADLAVDIP